MRVSSIAKAFAALAVPVAFAVPATLAIPAHADTLNSTTTVTHISNRPDSGNGGTWAFDTFDRTLKISVDNSVTQVSGQTAYIATVSDSGSFFARAGKNTPNQNSAVVNGPGSGTIQAAVSGSLTGTHSYKVTAPAGDNLVASTISAQENDNFSNPSGDNTSTNFPKTAFQSDSGVTVTDGSYSYVYKTGCETWADSSTNNGGDNSGDGNITGKTCAVVVPTFSNGHAISVSNNRENVAYDQSVAGRVKFEIVGPGAIDGHIGEVNGHVGTNTAVYTGLLAGHSYTVFYTFVDANGVVLPGTTFGYVDFTTTR